MYLMNLSKDENLEPASTQIHFDIEGIKIIILIPMRSVHENCKSKYLKTKFSMNINT